MEEMPKAYEPQQHEDALYERWEREGAFNPDNLPNAAERTPFTIVLPPPNATGTLHLGHSSMLAIEDVLIRFNRMNGKRALWVPGTDHAALATQNKVEKIIWAEEKKTRHDLGREELNRRIDAFVEANRNRMTFQMRKIGSSLDWSREAFTLDEPRNRAVRVIFKKMYDDGLIYRGKRVINWCARCASTLSDDEVETLSRKATLYYFKYNKDFPITIASTQPETKLGDTAVAVHPSDDRYKHLIGKTLEVAFGGTGGTHLKLRVIGEHTVEKEFGTGALGVTPAHSMVDYMMAQQHDLPLVQIISEDGLMSDEAGEAYKGLRIEDAREKVVAWLRAEGLIEKEEVIDQNVPVCSRCETVITPLPKLQWFVAVNKKFPFQQSMQHPIAGLQQGQEVSLTETMGHVVKSGQVTIMPARFEKTYFSWVNNLRDWCISRQIWYGHRIPVWYCTAQRTQACEQPMCSIADITACPHCGGVVEQDPDALDTWFSSGAWTFSVFGWPFTRVIFVRHGQAHSNVEGIVDCDEESQKNCLTDLGKQQIHERAASLKNEKIDAIIASPIARTKQTAEILSAELGVPVKYDARIREVGFGKYEGKSFEEFEHARGPSVASWYESAPDGIESFVHLKERTDAFMHDLLRTHAGQTVVVVSHGDTIGVMSRFGAGEEEKGIGMYPENGAAYTRTFAADGSQKNELAVYHPTDVLETGYDIIFNWVARMILMSTYALGEIPFRTVYLHGLVRDDQGRKMSKSLGNIIDPLDVIPKYGTDAVRLSLLIGQSPGNDLRTSEEKIAGFRNFTNKLWNVSRFILSQDADAEHHVISHAEVQDQPLTVLDKWIVSRLASVVREATESLEKYEFSRAGELIRDFTWNELADWYLEGAKVEGSKYTVTHYVLQNVLKLCHPFMPFVTEAIWQTAYAKGDRDFIMTSPWPDHTQMALYPEAEQEFARAQHVITAIRALRADFKVEAKETVAITLISKYAQQLALHQPIIERLARCNLLFLETGEAPENQLVSVIEEGVIAMPKPESDADDVEKLKLERDNIAHYIEGLRAKLTNQDFLGRAPAAVVEKEQAKLKEAEEKLQTIDKRLA